MTTNQIIAKLARVEVSGNFDADTRRIIRAERMNIMAAAQTRGDVRAATAEAVRVARMWGVSV